MPITPTIAVIKAYLGDAHSWTDAEVQSALTTEVKAQQVRVTFPPDPLDTSTPPVPIPQPYPSDLTEALCRRVAHNLAMRALPLGIQTTLTEVSSTATRLSGTDPEVRRLEAPYRRLVVG